MRNRAAVRTRRKIRLIILRNRTKRSNRTILLTDIFFHFIESWLLPCSLHSHRIANPRPKMSFAIFRLCPPTTRQAGGITLKRILLNLTSRKIRQFYTHTNIFSIFNKNQIVIVILHPNLKTKSYVETEI